MGSLDYFGVINPIRYVLRKVSLFSYKMSIKGSNRNKKSLKEYLVVNHMLKSTKVE